MKKKVIYHSDTGKYTIDGIESESKYLRMPNVNMFGFDISDKSALEIANDKIKELYPKAHILKVNQYNEETNFRRCTEILFLP